METYFNGTSNLNPLICPPNPPDDSNNRRPYPLTKRPRTLPGRRRDNNRHPSNLPDNLTCNRSHPTTSIDNQQHRLFPALNL